MDRISPGDNTDAMILNPAYTIRTTRGDGVPLTVEITPLAHETLSIEWYADGSVYVNGELRSEDG